MRRVGKEWTVSCSDEGIGIEPQYAKCVFAVFQRGTTFRSTLPVAQEVVR